MADPTEAILACLRQVWAGLDPDFLREAVRLTVALYCFWRAGGHPSEAEQWLNAMLALDSPRATAVSRTGEEGTASVLATLRARAEAAAGLVAFGQADNLEGMRRAELLLQRGLDAARRTGDVPSLVSVLALLSALSRLFGGVHGSEERFEEVLARQSRDRANA